MKKKILLLEDSLNDQISLRRCLKDTDIPFTLISCDSKNTFVGYLHNMHPDLIILDYNVPGFAFNEAFKLARDFYDTVPIIYITGLISKELAEETILVEANDYLLKEELNKLPELIKKYCK
ncbi:response regulator [Chondrinema litorale]|uniref:response regulator n=1 Tax=Chondrinema litorale TaxID=2994555 RepID=UPI002542E79B|nr:response regulator [Chondrinema litorale]UZR99043.1 response regulator [Chondrinema litorale]